MFVIREWPLADGRYFSPSEEASAGRVAIIGRAVAAELFGDTDPIGGEIRILNTPFQVIGVLAEKGLSGAGLNANSGLLPELRRLVRETLSEPCFR